FSAAASRDPTGLLLGQAESRVPERVPARHGRMLVSPFAYYRGAALPMAADLGADALEAGTAVFGRPAVSSRLAWRVGARSRAVKGRASADAEEPLGDRQVRDDGNVDSEGESLESGGPVHDLVDLERDEQPGGHE